MLRLKNPEVLARVEELRQNRYPDGTADDVVAMLLVDHEALEELIDVLGRRGEYRLTPPLPAGARLVFDFGDAPPSPELLDFPRPHGVLEAEGRRRRA